MPSLSSMEKTLTGAMSGLTCHDRGVAEPEPEPEAVLVALGVAVVETMAGEVPGDINN